MEDILDDNTYIATLNIPVTDLYDTLEYLNKQQVTDSERRIGFSYIRFRDGYSFVVPYHLFQGGRWTLDIDEQLSKISKSLRQTITTTARHKYEDSFRVALEASKRAITNQEKKETLEHLAAKITERVAGLTALAKDKRLSAEEVDLLVANESEEQFWSRFGSPFLIECKHWTEPVGSKEVRDLFGKLVSLGLNSAILISPEGITGNQYRDAKLLIREYRREGRYLVLLDENDLEQIADGLDPAAKIKDKYYQIFSL